LRAAALPVPRRLGADSTGAPRVRILILPDDSSPGTLETLCLRAIGSDRVLPCIEDFLRCAEQQAAATIRERDKAGVQSFLATRPRVGLLVGQAAAAGYWAWEHPCYEQVKRFLAAL
jgi:hypothetical protein